MVKGFSVIPAILIIIIAVTVVYSASLTWRWGETLERRADIVFHSYSMDRALDAAEIYMNVSLDYASYQACYEMLESIDPGISEDGFRQTLESGIKEKLNLYTKPEYRFLVDYSVNIFDYDDVSIGSLSPLKVKATGKDMFIRVDDNIRRVYLTMERGSSLEKTLGIDCYGIYLKGRDVHADINGRLGSSVKAKIDSWPDSSAELPDLGSLKTEIESIPELAFEKTEGSYSMKSEFTEAGVEFDGYEQSGTGPYENIKYRVTVKLNVTVRDTRDGQAFPVYDGEEVIFSPLEMSFAFEGSYSG